MDGFRFDLAVTLGRDEHVNFDPRASAARGDRERPRPRRREDDRRAVGRRRGRMAGGQLPERLVGVERRLPRPRARLLAHRHRRGAVDRRRHRSGSASSPRSWPAHPTTFSPGARAARERQLHHRPRRLHRGRPGLVQPEAQPRQRREQPRRHGQQPLLQPRCRGAEPRPGHHRLAREGDPQPARHPAALGRPADDHRRRRVRAQPARQQQRVLPRQRRSPGCPGSTRTGRRTCSRSRRPCCGCGGRTRRCGR